MHIIRVAELARHSKIGPSFEAQTVIGMNPIATGSHTNAAQFEGLEVLVSIRLKFFEGGWTYKSLLEKG